MFQIRSLSAALLGTLTLTAFTLPVATAQTIKGQSITVNPTAPATVTGLTLIDADTNKPVPGFDPIQPGATLDLARLPARMNMRANVSNAVKSVWFGLDGNGNYRLQGGAPYSLCNDNGGNFEPCPAAVFAPGAHSLLATPYAAANGAGTAGLAASLTYTVVRSAAAQPAPALSVTSFTLINADTNQPVSGFDPIRPGARLRLSALPPRLNVRANVGSGVRSVRFVQKGNKDYLENEAPFSLCGDSKDKSGKKGDYLTCDASRFAPGTHRLTATPFEKMFAGGTAGKALTLDFTVER
ncbi:hypothetical protein [Deinococcus humi]|uniref:Uncharacterized protein n=1 Tax=Deinococcus humi TaxID=662880 RepID=A0A7W8NDL0_9DEIO|nr:hypothetical protein [Deinococcus humi]MBB5361710.1 hypothetical protein [Deinococcus humi]GGO24059.1 hypothetical protein GCM10008949_12860 [Deinococcus humi]